MGGHGVFPSVMRMQVPEMGGRPHAGVHRRRSASPGARDDALGLGLGVVGVRRRRGGSGAPLTTTGVCRPAPVARSSRAGGRTGQGVEVEREQIVGAPRLTANTSGRPSLRRASRCPAVDTSPYGRGLDGSDRSARSQDGAAGVPGGQGERVEDRLSPGRAAGAGRIGAMTLTSCAWQAIADPVRVLQQGDEQAADDDGVGDGVGVLDQRRGLAESRLLSPSKRDWYQTFHSSKEIADALVGAASAATWSAVATTARMNASMSTAEARKASTVAVGGARSRCAGRCSRRVVGVLEDGRLPVPNVGIARLELPQATSSMDGSMQLHRPGGLGGEAAVLVGRLVADLPRAVHLVAEAPELDAVRLGGAVLRARSERPCRPGGCSTRAGRRPRQAAGAEVDGEHRLDAGASGPGHELVGADLVGLDRLPGEVEPRGAVLPGPTPSSQWYPETKLPPG